MEFIVGLKCVAKVTHRHLESNETETQTKKKPRLSRSNNCYHFLLGHLVAQFARSTPPVYGTRKAARALDIKAHDRGNGYGHTSRLMPKINMVRPAKLMGGRSTGNAH